MVAVICVREDAGKLQKYPSDAARRTSQEERACSLIRAEPRGPHQGIPVQTCPVRTISFTFDGCEPSTVLSISRTDIHGLDRPVYFPD